MTIRLRLLLLLILPLLAFFALTAFFLYLEWSHEVIFTVRLQNAFTVIEIIGIAAFIATFLIACFVARRIDQPVQQLNQAALEIAAGRYHNAITTQGPKEISELANTMNIMRECLSEQLGRLKESAIIREQMIGEHECALLLQRCMLQKVVDDFRNPNLQMCLTTVQSSNNPTGVLLKTIPQEENENDITISFLETAEAGFPGLFHLNQETFVPLNELPDQGFVECEFCQNTSLIKYRNHLMPPPLVWSVQSKDFLDGKEGEIGLHDRDMVFIYNSGLLNQFGSEEQIEAWLGRVLRHFAEDGINTIQTMLTSELNFLAKRHSLKMNCQIIGLQVKYTLSGRDGAIFTTENAEITEK